MAGHDFRAAHRYATALFNLASKEGSLQAIEEDLNVLVELMDNTPALRQMWESPLVPAGKKRSLLARILGEGVNPLTLSFLRLLVDKRREDILAAVREDVHRLADRSRHLLRAEAVFAVEPTEAEKEGLRRSLHERTGDQIELSVSVDPELLGGVVVRMHDNIIDGSVRGTLDKLREQLLQEA